MADESELVRILAGYGDGYRDPLGRGDSVDFNTANVLGGMTSQQAAKDHAGYNALSRLLMTAMAPWAAVPRGAVAASAFRRTPRDAALKQGKEELREIGPYTSEPNYLEYISKFRPFEIGGQPNSAHPMSMTRDWDRYFQGLRAFDNAEAPLKLNSLVTPWDLQKSGNK